MLKSQNSSSSLSKKAALLPSSGIGDGLLWMIAANLFYQKGYDVTVFHPKLAELKDWFPHISFLPPCNEYELSHLLKNYDWIFAQNDNSSRIQELRKAREEKRLPPLSLFYVTHRENKHGPLHPLDFVSDLSQTIGDNLALCVCHLLDISDRSKETGMIIPQHLQKSRFSKRIVLHPTSGALHKNWPAKKYLLLAQKLQEEGFAPIFAVSPKERAEWLSIVPPSVELPLFPTLSDFASFLYESSALIGNDSFAGHLGSYFSLPTLLLAAERKQMQLWQPSWRKASLLFPPPWVPNFKGLRLLKEHWGFFVSVDAAFKAFSKLFLSKP